MRIGVYPETEQLTRPGVTPKTVKLTRDEIYVTYERTVPDREPTHL